MERRTITLISLVLAIGQPGLALLNLSRGRQTISSDYREIYGPSSLVVDGNDSDKLTDPNNRSIPQCLYTRADQLIAFFQVNLGRKSVIDHVEIIFRKGGNQPRTHEKRRNGYSILVTDTSTYQPITPYETCYSDTNPGLSAANKETHSCSNIGSYVTIYNQRNTLSGNNYSPDAVLELCEVKVMGCEVHKHGSNCLENCPTNCFNDLCFPRNGTCMRGCKPGYTGSRCENPCDDFFFGHACLTECYCKEGPCNNVDGQCPVGGCDPGYIGTSCSSECNPGRFGDNCGETCGHCVQGSNTCDHRDGSCSRGCKPGYKVDMCIEECDSGTYGLNCGSSCGRCLNGAACHHINGTCLTGCAEGRMGNKCDNDCVPGTYGRNCESRCGNCIGGLKTCVITNGSCPGGCVAGWQHPLCQIECNPGTYGLNCAEECGRCRDGRGCNSVNGTCENGCLPGWQRPLCTQECSVGSYGNNCQERCGSCAEGNPCNHVDGRCPKDQQNYRCDPGFKAETCKNRCSSTEYGPDCSNACGQCFNSSCESVSGNCTNGCVDGWTGVRCTENLITPRSTSASQIAGGVVGSIALVVLMVVIVWVVKRKRQQKPSAFPELPNTQQEQAAYLDLQPQHDRHEQLYTSLYNNHVLYENLATDMRNAEEVNQLTYENVGNINQNVKQQNERLIELLRHEIVRKEECNEFKTDFENFLDGCQFPCEEASKDENKKRNRYMNKLPYDHSRVLLDGEQSYINANFIRDLDGTNAYVATQGPTARTLDDFWHMVWQLNSRKIIMLAECFESRKPKVEKYWPDAGSAIEHGGIKISCTSTKEYAAYTVRRLNLQNKDTKETRMVSQFHFVKWPDHGTPDVMHLALLLLHVESVDTRQWGPMIVHGSAGIGRTGTFIALDVLFRQGKSSGRVDPPAYVQSMRQDRLEMVQTLSQYKCIYHGLVELFLVDNTKLTLGDFGSNCLNSSRLHQEYEKLNGNRPTFDKNQMSTGMMEENQTKNRNPKILPSDQHRPCLSSYAANKTDYINAVFLSTVERYAGYIATQWPLPETADDFWAMIYDYRSSAAVILDSDVDPNDPRLMPLEKDSEISTENFSVQTDSGPCIEGSVFVAEVNLTKKGNTDSLKLKMFRVCDWPHDQQRCNEGSVTKIVYAVQEWQRNVTSAGPITVVCRNGSLKSGIFCSVANAIDNVSLNQNTSLVQVVRQLQLRRPSFINTYESYVMCDREVKIHFNSLAEYQNYKGPSHD